MIKEMTIKTAFDEEYPTLFYFIPSGFKGKTIIVTEDPYEGATCRTIGDKEKEMLMIQLGDEHKDLSGDNISNLLPICPQCNDTKNLTVSNAIKLSNPPLQTITCNECNISWDQRYWFDKIN